jgi:hypothetical protein
MIKEKHMAGVFLSAPPVCQIEVDYVQESYEGRSHFGCDLEANHPVIAQMKTYSQGLLLRV